jgi:phage shock protein PspC (stress-responsive transcriptional regulator)
MQSWTSPLSRGERWFITVAIVFGLVASVVIMIPRDYELYSIRGLLLLLWNGPGAVLGIITFAVLGGFSESFSIHDGLAFIAAIAALCVGNPIGYGVLAYLLIWLRHRRKRHDEEPASSQS